MATRIHEYGGRAQGDYPIVPATQKITDQSAMTATGTSAQSAAFSAGTRVVIIDSDEAVYVAFGSNPTATADSYRVKAGETIPFDVTPGWKVAIKT